jgi:hypothetical protein
MFFSSSFFFPFGYLKLFSYEKGLTSTQKMNGYSFKGFLAQGGKFCQVFFAILYGFNIEKISFSLFLSASFVLRKSKKGITSISGGYALDFPSLKGATSFRAQPAQPEQPEQRAWQAQPVWPERQASFPPPR